MKKAEEDHKPPKDAAFQKVVRYFLGHSKSKDGPAKPACKQVKAARKKPPTKKRP